MRTLSANAIAKIQEKGIEPIILIGVTWVDNGTEQLYGDKALPGVEGRIKALSGFSSTMDVDSNSTVDELSVTLDDSDGALKQLIDTCDIHKRPVNVYQYFTGLDLADKFPIFPTGQVASPIIWDEATRSLSFSIASKVEDTEAGFSTESATLNQYGKTEEKNWPLCFGDVLYVPATQVNENPVGRLKTAFGLVDPVLLQKRRILALRQEVYYKIMIYYGVYFGEVSSIAPEAVDVLTGYIEAIGTQDTLNRQIISAIEQLNKVDESLKKAKVPAEIQLLKATRNSLIINIKRLTEQIKQAAQVKDGIAQKTSDIEYEIGLKNQIIDKIQDLIDKIFGLNDDIRAIDEAIAKQQATTRTTIYIENGTSFPQGKSIELLIDNVRFKGTFVGDAFTMTLQGRERYSNIEINRTLSGENWFTITDETLILEDMYCFVEDGDHNPYIVKVTKQEGLTCYFELQEVRNAELTPESIPIYDIETQPGIKQYQITGFSETLLTQVDADPIDDTERDVIIRLERLDAIEKSLSIPIFTPPVDSTRYFILGTGITKVFAACPIVLPEWVNALPLNQTLDLAESQFFADFGTEIKLANVDAIVYVANILPSEVVGVYAYRTVGIEKILDAVPSDYYTLDEEKDLGDLTITTVTLQQKLSEYKDQNWEDEIYVSLKSSVGPNTVDIIIWLLETYTTFTYDSTSFNAVRTKLTNYPMNFAVFERKNVIEFIKEIARQARCAIWQKSNVFYIVYLSEEPTPVDTIDDNDVIVETLKLKLTETEELATKLIGKWRPNYLPDTEQEVTLRYNVNKYGTQELTIDFYAYTNRELVEKSLTFWLIRKSNTWLRVELSTPLTKLNLETFDAVTLDLDSITVGQVIAIIESATYDSDQNVINFELWTPVRIGD